MFSAVLTTPAGDAGCVATKTVDDDGTVHLRIQNNMSPHWFRLSFAKHEWYVMTMDMNLNDDGK